MTAWWRCAGFVTILAAAALFANLGGSRLWDRDEPRNAGCAREMLDRSDWVTPVFNGELRAHKPALLYWLMISAYSVFGVNEFSARFWSAVLAVGTTVCTFEIGRRLFHWRAGVWAGIVLATCLLFQVAGRAATPDSALIFFSTLAMAVFLISAFPRTSPRLAELVWQAHGGRMPIRPAALMYASMGLGVLAKGPVGFVLPVVVIGVFLLTMQLSATTTVRGQQHLLSSLTRLLSPLPFLRVCWSMRLLVGIAICALVAAPWYVWVGIRTEGEFLRVFFGEHHFGRATQAMEGHGGPIFFYPLAILVGTFPWSVFAAPLGIETVRRVSRREEGLAGTVLAICWVAVYVGAFSLAKTKLPSYVTPCYPALALLMGVFLDRFVQGSLAVSRLWLRLALASHCLVGLVFLSVLPFVLRRYLPGDEWLSLIGLVPFLTGMACLVTIERGSSKWAAVTFAGGAVAFTWVVFGVAASRIDRHQQGHVLLAVIDRAAGSAQVGAFRCLEPSWVFYGGRPIDELTEQSPAQTDDRRVWGPKRMRSLQEFARGKPNSFIITTADHLDALRASLPQDFRVLADVPRFLRGGRLYLLGRSDDATRVAAQPVGGEGTR